MEKIIIPKKERTMIGKYHIVTYGCQMNVHESEKMAGILRKMGYEEAPNKEDADIILFNTCCIRENAENHAFGNIGALKKLKKQKPELLIAVGGCMTQEKGKTDILRKKFPFIDIMFGTLNLEELESLILRKKQQKKKVIQIREKEGDVVEFDDAYRTSYPNAWVNITYGCNNFCSYCIVPYVRGRERSRNPENIVKEVKKLVAEGYKEITLLGQNVNSYDGDKKFGVTFAQLLDRVASIEGKFRLRFMTSHPKDLSEDVIDAVAMYPNICNNIHLPVQSGSTEILRRMNRRYTREKYLECIQMIKSKLPDVGITTDIMVGFPGETEEDFLDTLDLVEKAKYSSAFCFVYSRRKGTPADTMDNQIPDDIKKDRITRLIACQNKVTREISKQMTGQVYEILVEGSNPKYDGVVCGRTESGRLVNFKGDQSLIGQFVNVKIEKSASATLWGVITTEEK